jgi:hypothetical protein
MFASGRMQASSRPVSLTGASTASQAIQITPICFHSEALTRIGTVEEENDMLSSEARSCLSHLYNPTALVLLSTLLVFLFTPLARPQQHDMDNMAGMNMNVPTAPEDLCASSQAAGGQTRKRI